MVTPTLEHRSMTITHHSRIHRLGAVIGLLFVTAGCSAGGDEGSTGTTTGTSGATTGVTTGSTGASSTPTSGGSTDGTSTTSTPTSGGSTDGASASSTSTSTSTGTASTGDTSASSSTSAGEEPSLSLFVSSSGSPTGNLGGLAGADQRCQDLADAVGAGGKTWHAYLSVEKGPDDQPVHAKDRIGAGPWYNAALVMVAADVADLHTKLGDVEVFLDENGEKVPGQWKDSPAPNEHDILTGSNKDGTVAPGKTCADWTSEDSQLFALVGHSDGLGPMGSDADQYRSWNSVHENGGCHDTAPKGGAGRVYCFAID